MPISPVPELIAELAAGRMVVLVDEEDRENEGDLVLAADRGKLQAGLRERGVPTAIHYPAPLHRQPAYAAYAHGAAFPVSESLGTRVISLPMHPDLQPDLQDRIVAAVRQASA